MMTVPCFLPTTNSLLAVQFNNMALIPLEIIAKEFLGLTPAAAKRKARNQELPFPVIRLIKSQKSPWLINFDDLVAYVERMSQEAYKDWYMQQC
ncbi:hypothetical protein A6E03_04240 [Aliivibrio sp. 1S128]|nr:hypothetical protein A6E03_04240 [Aliivibrio sp. 1S128]